VLVNYHADASSGGTIFTSVYVFGFRTRSPKPVQLGSPNLTYKFSMTSPGNHLFCDQKVNVHASHNQCRRGSLRSCYSLMLASSSSALPDVANVVTNSFQLE